MPRNYIQAHLAQTQRARAIFEMYDVNIMVEIATTIDDRWRSPILQGKIHWYLCWNTPWPSFLDKGAILDAVVAQNSAQRAGNVGTTRSGR